MGVGGGDAFCRHTLVYGVSAPRSTLPGMAEKPAGIPVRYIVLVQKPTSRWGLVIGEGGTLSFFFLEACTWPCRASHYLCLGLCRVLGCGGFLGGCTVRDRRRITGWSTTAAHLPLHGCGRLWGMGVGAVVRRGGGREVEASGLENLPSREGGTWVQIL